MTADRLFFSLGALSALVSVAAIAALGSLGNSLGVMFNRVANELSTAVGNTGG